MSRTTGARPPYGRLNGLHVALQPDGQLSSWVDQVQSLQPYDTPGAAADAC